MNYQDKNAEVINGWVENGWEWGKPISHDTYMAALNGKWDVLLTPNKPVPHEWFGEMKGRRILGLACGGGQQMPIFAALGAVGTVFDYSEKMLDGDRAVCEREGCEIRIVRGDMSKALPFPDESFDLIFHPVSNVYVEDVYPIWRECFRILKHGGVLLAGLDNGLNFAYDEDEAQLCNVLPFNPLKNEAHRKMMEEENAGYEFSHNIDEQIGGQLMAGFRLTHVYGDTNNFGKLHEHNVDTFWATRAIKD